MRRLSTQNMIDDEREEFKHEFTGGGHRKYKGLTFPCRLASNNVPLIEQ